MKKLSLILPLMIGPALAATARGEAPTVLLAQTAMPATGPDVSQGGNGTDATPGANGMQNQDDNASPSDWMPPTEPHLDGPDDDNMPPPRTDGTSPLPTLEWRPAVDSSQTDAAADADLGPRVDLAGPGTPKWKVVVYVSQTSKVDDNIFISHTDKQADVYFSIAPGFAAGWGDFRSALLAHATGFADQYQETREPVSDPLSGDFLYMNYTANATHFLSHDSQDSVDQDAALNGQWDFTKTVVSLDARVQTLTGPDIDVGTRTRRTLYTFDAGAQYTISDKTSLDLTAGGIVRDYVTQLSSSDWHSQLYLNYELFPKTTIGAGLTAGVRELDTTPNQYYQQAQLKASYTATEKLSVNVNAGVELDEASGQGSDQLTPVFGLGAVYNITDTDSLNLDAYRSTQSSAVTTGETVEVTSVNLGFHHRLFSNFAVQLNGGYTHSDFYTQGLSTLARTDDYIFLKPSIAYDFAQYSELVLAYEYHRDISTDAPNDFAENIASLELNFVF